jgi:c-di-GMP-related signal transduction protein
VQTFVARQPIFDHRQEVYAYELLFRSSYENSCNLLDLNKASSKVIVDTCLLIGLEHLTGDKKAFINVTREVLINEYIFLLPSDKVIVEILETVEPDESVITACKKLKQSGYKLALDDFVYEERYQPLVELADIIKVDFLSTAGKEQKELVDRFSSRGIRFLAEKVETREKFQEATNMGYSYFQGYFFGKPVVYAGRDIPGFKLNYLQILQEIYRSDMNFAEIESIIKRDLSLSYKLLRYINSAFFSRRSNITSIKQALSLLGEQEIRKWVSLIALSNMGQDKPEELVIQAVIRAKFCESLAPNLGLKHRSEDLFLMGMFSLIDALLDRRLIDILNELPIKDDVKEALLGEPNRLRNIINYVEAYEKGEWAKLPDRAAALNADDKDFPGYYLDAVEWTNMSFKKGLLNAEQ